MKKSEIIETGKVIITGVILGAAIKAIACVAVEAAKAKAAPADADDDIVVIKREIAYEDIPEFIRAKLEK